MLKTKVLHPQILSALGRSGHGSRVLIADGNYPFSTCSPKESDIVYLNFKPGVLGVTEILQGISEIIPIESTMVMSPPDDSTPPIFNEFERIMGDTEMVRVKRQAFYNEVKKPDTALVIASGEQRRFANILLTIGVIKQNESGV